METACDGAPPVLCAHLRRCGSNPRSPSCTPCCPGSCRRCQSRSTADCGLEEAAAPVAKVSLHILCVPLILNLFCKFSSRREQITHRRKERQRERERERERLREGGGPPSGVRRLLTHLLITSAEDKMDSVNALWKLVLGPQDINLNSKMIYPNSTTINAP